eukprot:m.177483 g.177483  ORF g.177483 m.177483 type:complete len:210 (+) comp9971_c0_seq13:225-854(+)
MRSRHRLLGAALYDISGAMACLAQVECRPASIHLDSTFGSAEHLTHLCAAFRSRRPPLTTLKVYGVAFLPDATAQLADLVMGFRETLATLTLNFFNKANSPDANAIWPLLPIFSAISFKDLRVAGLGLDDRPSVVNHFLQALTARSLQKLTLCYLALDGEAVEMLAAVINQPRRLRGGSLPRAFGAKRSPTSASPLSLNPRCFRVCLRS